MFPVHASVASWWSYADGDATLAGAAVLALLAGAVGLVGGRALARARRRR